MSMILRRVALGIVGIVLPMLVGAPVYGTPSILFLNGGGDFLVYDPLSERVESLWMLSAVQGLGEVVPDFVMDGLGVEGAAFEPDLRNLYLVVPKQVQTDEWGRRGYQVIAVSFPTYELLGSWELPVRPEGVPSIVLLPESKRLLVSYTESEPWDREAPEEFNFVISVLRTPQLKFVDRIDSEVPRDPRQRAPGQGFPFLSPEAVALSDDLFLDVNRVLRLQDGALTASLLDLQSPLSADQLALVKSISTVAPPAGELAFSFGVVSVDQGHVLVQVIPTDFGPDPSFALFVLDALSRVATPPFKVSPVRAWLIEEGTQVLTLELDGESMTTTGDLVVYAADSGTAVLRAEVEELSGLDARGTDLLCSVKRKHFFRGGDDSVVGFDAETRESTSILADFYAGPWTRCFTVPAREK